MTYLGRNYLIPPAQKALADQICADLGYPELGMFTVEMREGPPPPLGDPDPRPITGYVSTGPLDDTSAFNAIDEDEMLAIIEARNPATTVTQNDCREFLTWMDRTDIGYMPPLERIPFVTSETNGIPTPNAWVRPTGETGYEIDEIVRWLGVNWRNLTDNNLEAPRAGSDGWRRIWE